MFHLTGASPYTLMKAIARRYPGTSHLLRHSGTGVRGEAGTRVRTGPALGDPTFSLIR